METDYSTSRGWQIRSSGLSNHFFLRFGLGPSHWRELLDLGDLGRWQTREQIFEIVEWIDPVTPTTGEQSVNYRAPFPGFRMADEQPIFLSNCAGPN